MIKRSFKSYIKECITRFFYRTRSKTSRIVYFSSFGGKQYSDSPRAISEILHKLDPTITIVWAITPYKNIALPKYITTVNPNSINHLKVRSIANVWVMNNDISTFWGDFKGENTLFINTYHGDRGFKKVGFAAMTDQGIKYHCKDSLEPSHADIFLTGSTYGEKLAIEGLHTRCEFMKYGIPRNDKLVHLSRYRDEITSIKQVLNINSNTKVLLFAPTFRDNTNGLQHTAIDIPQALSALESNNEKWICLVRAHTASKGLYIDNNPQIIDVSNYSDMADLLMIADCLITDYSSSAGDFILTEKPVVLVHFDKQDYIENARTLCFDPDISGFLIAKTQKELNKILSKIYTYDHKAINKIVRDFYGTYETGESSIKVAKRILEYLNKPITKIGDSRIKLFYKM